ncbi:hypothetical protein HKX48_006060 [Thoreauomyces humboldtii]|nr:hypothetical protein HKX48_006060 [Thoreauomyces humboldtii]
MNDTTTPAVPPDCLDLLANLTTQFQSSQDQQSETYGDDFCSLIGTVGAVLHCILLALFSDRLAAIKSKPAVVLFFFAIVADALNWINLAMGNSEGIPWFWEVAGTNFYFYVSVVTIVTFHLAVSLLQFWRVKGSLRISFGRSVEVAFHVPFVVQLCLELANQLYGAILYSISLNYDQELYVSGLVWSTLGYRLLLDLSMNVYALSIVYSAPGGRSREDRAFLVAYLGRILVFLAIDVLAAVSATSPLDLTFSSLSVYTLPRVLQPFKPYLLLTDVARVKMIADRIHDKGRKGGGEKGGPAKPKSEESGGTRNGKSLVMFDASCEN